jgi:hypothetical protein
MTTVKQEKEIAETLQKELLSALKDQMDYALQQTLCGGYDLLIATIADEFLPEEIFDGDTLNDWAVQNGYVKVQA